MRVWNAPVCKPRLPQGRSRPGPKRQGPLGFDWDLLSGVSLPDLVTSWTRPLHAVIDRRPSQQYVDTSLGCIRQVIAGEVTFDATSRRRLNETFLPQVLILCFNHSRQDELWGRGVSPDQSGRCSTTDLPLLPGRLHQQQPGSGPSTQIVKFIMSPCRRPMSPKTVTPVSLSYASSPVSFALTLHGSHELVEW